MSASLDRRDFARLFTLGGAAALLGHPGARHLAAAGTLRRPLRHGHTVDWDAVRSRFLLPTELSVLNAANLCPSPRDVLLSVSEDTERLDRDPVPTFRDEMHGVKEDTRALVAGHLKVAPENVLITRNTSEANNWVSGGLDLGAGDEVLIFSDNHPSNNQAWKAKGERFGYTVREVPQVNPHPGMEYYVDAFRRALTPRTRVLAFTHLTNTAGDLFPAAELCRMARDAGVVTLVDGAQSFGLMDVDLSEMDPDFYSGSAHKWPCGPKETGVLYVNPRVQDRFWPSLYSAYTGRSGLARTHEGMGQRDEPAIRAFGREIVFLGSIGQGAIEARSRELADAAVEGLGQIPGVHLWTSTDPALRVAVVSFRPAELDPRRVLEALEAEGIVATARPGDDRGGIRFSPHFYNSFHDVERAVEAIGRYVRQGL
ncbi:MAG: aminotransferase class V-fold PLP-dependent enzyme [Gemmatimonadota bacterium]|nr:aminotransferase class V-fold PLP-dependent enzyme [Gemmatimonadota bacterium]